ncbi:MAG TPA: L-histidine N(alpha)-methyltransferase, partial [Gemmatimonadales bacterium]|nr:L-histidine N(alpha)-methyltransferase [Gemmatimonadales bacterium]
LNRRFAWAPLRAVGITEGEGEIVFEDRRDERMPGLHPLAKHFRAARDCAALTGGEVLEIEAGERIALNHSYKYSREALARILADAGLAARWQGTSDDERFLMILAGTG